MIGIRNPRRGIQKLSVRRSWIPFRSLDHLSPILAVVVVFEILIQAENYRHQMWLLLRFFTEIKKKHQMLN